METEFRLSLLYTFILAHSARIFVATVGNGKTNLFVTVMRDHSHHDGDGTTVLAFLLSVRPPSLFLRCF
jgi:hypothetical protein